MFGPKSHVTVIQRCATIYDTALIEYAFRLSEFSCTRDSPNEHSIRLTSHTIMADLFAHKIYMLGLKSDSRTVQKIMPTVSDVKEAMATGEFDAWHFTGHARADIGVNADQSAIEVNDQEPLSPEQIVGNAENLLQTQPFVFLNACQTAQSGMSLTGAGGWAQRLVKVTQNYKSASAFIGTYWSVDDKKALEFAKILYKSLLDGKSIGDAAMQARLEIKGQDDPAWLAYTVYADPSAKIA